MKYLYCVAIPVSLQLAAVYIIGVMNTGNGSWLGLGVFLLAIPVVPITAAINAARTHAKYAEKTIKLFLQSLLVAFIVPLLISLLFILNVLVEGFMNRHY